MEYFRDFERSQKRRRKYAVMSTRCTVDKPSYAVDLKHKQRTQVRFRNVKMLSWNVAAAVLAALIFLFALTSLIKPETYIPDFQERTDNGLVIDFVGDVMLDRGVKSEARAYGYDRIFSGVTDYWHNADYVFANLESAVLRTDVSDYQEAQKAIHLYTTDREGLYSAMSAGINVFSCANNHSYDYCGKAVLELIDYFNRRNTIYAGIGTTLDDAATYKIIEHNGLKIAYIAITDVYYTHSTNDKLGVVLTMKYSDYNLLVYQAAQEADVTVVYIHWGSENEPTASERQIELGHQLIDAGADMVIGSHPHVLQEVELYRNGIIFYSLGNFIFDQGNTFACDSVMVEYTADEQGKGEFCLYPVRINDGVPSVTKSFFYKERINNKLSAKLDDDSYHMDENGFIVIPFDLPLSD